MKATIDIPEDVYRKVKAKSALEGRPVREVAITLFSAWVNQSDIPLSNTIKKRHTAKNQEGPAWFASLRRYARNARGRYDMDSIRRSIARGRAKEEQTS